LALVCESYREVHAVSFNYGQENLRELIFAEVLAALSEVKSHRMIKIRSFRKLTESNPVQKIANAAPEASSYHTSILGRVMLYFFIGTAGVVARSLGTRDVFLGVSKSPKKSFLNGNDILRIAGESAKSISSSMDYEIKIHTPFVNMDKAELIAGMIKNDRLDWWAGTCSCLRSERYLCGHCSGCLDRAKAFESIGMEDPLHKRIMWEALTLAQV
jgi:7-cyano-7-deazaguanine synthase